LLSLPHRVRNLALPQVELIDMKQERRLHHGINLISHRLESLLHQTLDAGQQAILLLNRRGYSNFVYCVSCQKPLQCKYCDATLTYHRSADVHAQSATSAEGMHTGQLYCHYCLAVSPLSQLCTECGKKLSLFGLGTQRVEEELVRKFPALVGRFARVDSDSMRSGRDYEKLLDRFGRGEIQVMLGTQMIAKGLDYPNVTLVGVISGDTALALPDFRAAERTFQMITQVAGRAGRGDVPGRVILQTFLPDDPIFRYAIRQDYLSFANAELSRRSEVALPPFTRMVRIVMRDQDLEKLKKCSEELAAALSSAVVADPGTQQMVTLKGPSACVIGRVSGYHRYQIVMSATRAEALQRVLLAVRESGGLARSDRIAVDVDPVALL
jgi:primosomal protein N' (replication factor Y)